MFVVWERRDADISKSRCVPRAVSHKMSRSMSTSYTSHYTSGSGACWIWPVVLVPLFVVFAALGITFVRYANRRRRAAGRGE